MKLKQAMDADTAAAEIDIMKGVVTEGTGGKAALDDVAVAGKTGTAEVSNSNVNSTFIGFAPYDTPTVAIAVVVENYNENGVSAASVAGEVLAAALAAQG